MDVLRQSTARRFHRSDLDEPGPSQSPLLSNRPTHKWKRVNGAGDRAVPGEPLSTVLHQLVAARASLIAAERELPVSTTTIDGKPFWQRFSRLSHERERRAREELLRDSWNV
jgi:hypothetical protein